jgi:hypothetical protein
MKLLRGFLLALWSTLAVAISLPVGFVFLAPRVVDRVIPTPAIPWLFVLMAVAASALAAFAAHLFPSVAARYSWLRLTLSGLPCWPLAWVWGRDTLPVFEDALKTAGISAVSFTFHGDLTWWGAALLVTVVAVLLRVVEPPPQAA